MTTPTLEPLSNEELAKLQQRIDSAWGSLDIDLNELRRLIAEVRAGRAERASEIWLAERAVIDSMTQVVAAYRDVNAICDREGLSAAYTEADARAEELTRRSAKRANELLMLRTKKDPTP